MCRIVLQLTDSVLVTIVGTCVLTVCFGVLKTFNNISCNNCIFGVDSKEALACYN